MPAHRIVFANEKGGSGKSTTAVHVAIALASAGRKVAALDLDTRQRTLGRYLDNRSAMAKSIGQELATARHETYDPAKSGPIEERIEAMADGMDVIVIDTPGRDDDYVRTAISMADTLVTPINDSFIDLDLIGQVHAETFKVTRPSFYAEIVWDARKARGKRDGATVDWVVLRNRLQHLEARNMRRVASALAELSKRVGFRTIAGLSERVIYRELFPKGLTLLDLGVIGSEAGMGHIAARQELRELIAGLQLPALETAEKVNEPA
ncbi:AAA family ATPase [Sphingomonas sp. AP4-R1]|uniref:division plane positioning ATPase MipZ n=1 Tax=Sphingomonas sp. AP4-R1 TaxID=2735134 RepID=UPI00149339A6|nr:division plane positioning ATPase MipZ [Sphingomonas sp. AP4-R1]QJU56719.1 AAA family ATPase [Sphingomonas sp. AP4-R1]